MPYLSEETIARAREVDLLSYLKSCAPGELVDSGGGEYSTRSHDSLKISNGMWYWWSRGIGGRSAVDYLVKVNGMDFVSAVEAVMGRRAEIPSVIAAEKKKKYDRVYPPRYSFYCPNAKKYLLERGIDAEIIDDCIARKMIAETKKNGSVLFLGYDEQGRLMHACVRATDGSSAKKDIAGSDKRYVFSLASAPENVTVRVFESAIDLLSYATMLKRVGRDYRKENLISLSGIYLPQKEIENTKIPQSVEHYLATHPNTKRICFYLDNDYAGRRGAEAMQVILGKKYEVKYIPPPVGKDYNDYLKTKNFER